MRSPTILFCDNNYLSLQYDPRFKSGGATKQVVAWVEGLKRVGVNAMVLGAHSKPEFFKGREDTIVCYDPTKGIPKLRYLYIRIPGILRAVSKAQPDYLYYGIPSPFAGLIGLCARLTGRKFILRVSNDFFVDGRASRRFDPFRRFCFRMGFRFADSILCQNEYQFERIRRDYPTKAFKIKNPYLGAIADRPVPFEEREGVAWVGIFQRQKNLPLLLKVARALPDVSFKVAGGNDRPLGEADQAALDELKLLPNVRLMGFLRKEEVLELLESSRLLMNTSHYEGFSNTFLEAFSRGTPVFTLPQNDPDGMIRKGDLGGAFASDDDLIAGVRDFLGDGETFASVSGNCLKHMEKEHNLLRQAESFLRIVSAPEAGLNSRRGRGGGKRPLIVEFVGHAGSGKSFLADRVVSRLREEHRVSREMKVTMTDLLLFGLTHSGVVFDLLRLVIGVRPKGLKTGFKAFSKLGLYQVKRHKAMREGGGVIVFDEGMLHRFRMLRSSGNGARLSYAAIDARIRKRLFPAPDLVVFVVASLETTAERKVGRDGAKSGGETAAEMINRKKGSFAASLRATEEDILAAQREQGFRAITVVNEEETPVEESIRRILAEALPRAESGREPVREPSLV